MVTDLLVSSVASYLRSNGGAALADFSIYERDNGGDLQYPAIIVAEEGDPEEHDLLRGQWRVTLSVLLVTVPEDDESANSHQIAASHLTSLLGDNAALKTAIESQLTCWDCWGAGAATTPEDGYRTSTFMIECQVSLSS